MKGSKLLLKRALLMSELFHLGEKLSQNVIVWLLLRKQVPSGLGVYLGLLYIRVVRIVQQRRRVGVC